MSGCKPPAPAWAADSLADHVYARFEFSQTRLSSTQLNRRLISSKPFTSVRHKESKMTSSKLLHQGFAGSVEVSTEDCCLHGRILFIDDIVTYEGQTVPELKVNFQAAVDRYLAYCKRTGKPANKPYSGTFNVRVGPALHKKAAVAAQAAGMNLNEYILAALNSSIA